MRSEPAQHSAEHPWAVFGLFHIDSKLFFIFTGDDLNVGHTDWRRNGRGSLMDPEVLGHGRVQGAPRDHRLQSGLPECIQDVRKPLARL